MFSGLIAHLGRIAAIEGDVERGITLSVHAPDAIAEGVEVKDSVAINGVCLTVTAVDAHTMHFDVVPETIRRAAFDRLAPEAPVNVELSLRLGDRLGGHLVYGHVDAHAAILAKEPEGQGYRLAVETPPEIAAYIVEKGYVSVDGVSLTIASTAAGRFTIALIPETAKRTTLGSKRAGDRVTLEIDPIARYALGAATAYADGGVRSDEIAWAFEI
jgi:riboflavin synthase